MIRAATRSPARSCTSCGPARWHAPASYRTAVLRLGRLHTAVADPLRRDVRLDRRPPDGRSAMAERRRGHALDRRIRRSRPRRIVEYERRSDRGLLNQGWKDSSDAIRDRDGKEAAPPIALAEVQGYVYDAKRRMARLAAVRGETDLAIRLDAEADQLATRFEQAFWMEDRRYYAIALDRDKRQADAIASNAGQCLWTGIVTPDRARDVMDRILRPEMFSGWECGRSHRASPVTTPSAITRERSGRTTSSSRPASSGTASTTPRTGSSAR